MTDVTVVTDVYVVGVALRCCSLRVLRQTEVMKFSLSVSVCVAVCFCVSVRYKDTEANQPNDADDDDSDSDADDSNAAAQSTLAAHTADVC